MLFRSGRPFTVTGHGGGNLSKHSQKPGPLSEWQSLMGTPWITTRHGIAEAIPPTYTCYIMSEWLNHMTYVPSLEVT